MRRFTLLMLVCILTFSGPAAAQSSEPYTDPCDQLPLRDWPKSQDVRVQNGVCVLQNASLIAEEPLRDFIVRFKLSMEQSAQVEFTYGTSINDTYSLTITPAGVSLMNYIRFGNASNTVLDSQLAKASFQRSPDEWVNVEFGMQAHRQWLAIDDKTVIDRKTARYSAVGIHGTGGVYLDDIQLIQNELSVNGEQLASYPSGLAQTWIAYNNDRYELALVHADGTSRQVLAAPLAENYTVQASFSPDGKSLLISRGDGTQTLLSFYSLETLQFVGAEIRLPRSPLYDWMPDGQHLIVLNEQISGNLTLESINIQNGQSTSTYAVPSIIDQETYQIQSIQSIDCSPASEMVILDVYGNFFGENTHREILFDMLSQQVRFLPGVAWTIWSVDGRLLFSSAGGLIDPQTLVFTEFSSTLIERGGLFMQNYAWSPNGQFIYVGTENPGKEEFAVYILDIDAEDVLTLPLSDFGSFAPDSLHFAFSDSGRVIVRSLFDIAELQIAEGFNPIWQPAPEMYPAVPTRPKQPTATPTAFKLESTAQATLPPTNTATHLIGDAKDDPLTIAGAPREPMSNNHRSAWPVTLLVLGLLGLIVTGSIAWLRFSRRCPSCRHPNIGVDPFCMHCGTHLPLPTRTGTISIIILGMLGIFGCLVIVSTAGILIQTRENLMAPVSSIGIPNQVTQSERPLSLPTEQDQLSSARFPCGTLDLAWSDLLEVIQEGDARQQIVSKFYSLEYSTPQPDPTTAAHQLETQVAYSTQLSEIAGELCSLTFLSISPDQQHILVSSRGIEDSGQKDWTILYDQTTYQPIWIQPIRISNIQWNPTGESFAVSENEALNDKWTISVYETATGSLISQIPASTRQGAYCDPMNFEGNIFRWLPDGKHMVRKISNAVQVLNSTTGEVMTEITFDDSVMGSGYSPDNTPCQFAFAWAPDGSRFATMGTVWDSLDSPTYGKFKIWDAVSGKLIVENQLDWVDTKQMTFSPAGDILLIAGNSVALIDARTGQLLQHLSDCPVCYYPNDIFWSPDGQKIFIHEGQSLSLYDMQSRSWKLLSSGVDLGNFQEWLNERGNMLMTGNGTPIVINVVSGEVSSLIEYFKSSH